MTDDDMRLLDMAEAAHLLCTTQRHVRRLTDEGRLPKVKVGPLVRIKRSDVADYIAANRVEAGEQ